MKERGYSADPSDARLRADVASEILDTAKIILDSDPRTMAMTYGEAQNFVVYPSTPTIEREMRRATVESIEAFQAFDPQVGTVLKPNSQYRMVAGGHDRLDRSITYSLTDVRTSIIGLTRVLKMSMSDAVSRRLRGVALTASGEVHTMSEVRTKKTEGFELQARLLIIDDLSDMRDALLTGKELPFETVVACLDDIRHSLELSQPDMNVDEFMGQLYTHYEEARQTAETRRLVHGGIPEMPTTEMIALRNYMDGDDAALGIYDED